MEGQHFNVVECGTQDYHFRGIDDLVEVMNSRLLLNVSKRIQSRKYADVAAAAGRAIEHLRALGVEAKLVGSLARGDFSMDSDVDILVTSCPESLRYAIEADVEDELRGYPFDVIYLDEVRSSHFKNKLLSEAVDAPRPY